MSDPSAISDAATPRRRPELDGLRGLAILLVMIWHYVGGQLTIKPHTPLFYATRPLSLTWSGVDLFFVLSGFLIGGILLDNRGGQNYFRAFYIRRACRIFPLYILWLVLFVVLGATLGNLPRFAWLFEEPLPLWSYATFTQNLVMAHEGRFGPHWISVTWSLAIEEQFYLFLPLFIHLMPRRALPFVTALLIGGAWLLRDWVVRTHPHPGYAAYVWMPCRADALLLGVLAAIAFRAPRLRQVLERCHALFYIGIALAASGLIFLSLHAPPPDSSPMALFGYSLLALLYTCLLWLAVTEKRGPVAAFFRWRPLVQLGILAYGIYLFHQAVNGLAHGLIFGRAPHLHSPAHALLNLLCAAVSIALAALSWRYLEKPCVAFGHTFAYRTKNSQQPDSRP